MARGFFSKLETQLPTTPIPLAKSRLILYLLLFIFSTLSAVLYLVSIFHDVSTNYDRTRYWIGHDFVAIALIPLSWAAVWSFIVLRTLLLAIDHNASTPTTDDSQAGPTSPANPHHSRLAPAPSPESPYHRSSRCCCCTCTPWFPRSSGPHPVFCLCIDILIFSILSSLGTLFGILFSSLVVWPSPLSSEAWDWKEFLDSCPRNYYGTDELDYSCTLAWKVQLALDGFAGVGLLVAVLVEGVAVGVGGVLVHRWRGEMGLWRGKRGKRVDRTSGITDGDVEGGDGENGTEWVELPKMGSPRGGGT